MSSWVVSNHFYDIFLLFRVACFYTLLFRVWYEVHLCCLIIFFKKINGNLDLNKINLQMPEMKSTMEEALENGYLDALLVLSLQTTGLALGTFSMFFFARYGDLIKFS